MGGQPDLGDDLQGQEGLTLPHAAVSFVCSWVRLLKCSLELFLGYFSSEDVNFLFV